MAYLVLARKYRPQTFDQVVQQNHVTQTLANSIVSKRVAHAILFAGPRGTGKTTVARVLAKAMNCEKGPTVTPCNQCKSCSDITTGSASDVIEIDGASNNGVDHIRELRENIRYMPAHSPYKIYIIDEVHMLSIPAFNALLKTLEEPPAHVMFLFATTEPAKIPITILSRCQRHDLRRIDIEAVCAHMETLCNQESVKMTQESLLLIARESGGSMRDALSLLDQMIACTSGEITHERVLEILGAVDRSVMFQCAQAILQGDMATCLTVLDDIYNRGLDMRKLYDDLTEHFRNLLIVKVGQQVKQLVDLPAHEIKIMQEQVASVSASLLSQLFDLLFKEEAVIRYASHPKLALESIVIRISHLAPALSIDSLIEKLDLLRNEIKGTQGAHDATGLASAATTRHPPDNHQTVKAPLAQYNASSMPPPVPDKRVKEPKPVSTSPVLTDDMPNEQILRLIIQLADQRHPSLSAHLSHSSIATVKDNRIEIEISANAFTAKMMRRDKNKSDLKKVCDEAFGKNMEIIIKDDDKSQPEYKQPQKQSPKRPQNPTNQLHEEALSNPLVMEAVHVFNGEITKVNIL
ncbi:DNA polymerase III subunit gamma/tau [Desulfococcaceae bacterium HSG9]|nr:DNA polymerase III subunit gamma/tau [Desulfococcaceae bacterium HSG9]